MRKKPDIEEIYWRIRNEGLAYAVLNYYGSNLDSEDSMLNLLWKETHEKIAELERTVGEKYSKFVSGEDEEDDERDHLVEYLKSDKFKEDFRKKVESDTWERGYPMYYVLEGWIVEHWKDGTIRKIRELRVNE